MCSSSPLKRAGGSAPEEQEICTDCDHGTKLGGERSQWRFTRGHPAVAREDLLHYFPKNRDETRNGEWILGKTLSRLWAPADFE
jgi:hypothetical protein